MILLVVLLVILLTLDDTAVTLRYDFAATMIVVTLLMTVPTFATDVGDAAHCDDECTQAFGKHAHDSAARMCSMFIMMVCLSTTLAITLEIIG